ncbi:MAG: hypothetical protein AVDCRST_MAG40-1999, partial [uncultured Gemmatimonadaceae bacterium]
GDAPVPGVRRAEREPRAAVRARPRRGRRARRRPRGPDRWVGGRPRRRAAGDASRPGAPGGNRLGGAPRPRGRRAAAAGGWRGALAPGGSDPALAALLQHRRRGGRGPGRARRGV